MSQLQFTIVTDGEFKVSTSGGEVMKRFLGSTTVAVLLVLLANGQAATGVEAVTGTWEGESLCTIPSSPCKNEHVVYEIKPDRGTANGVTIEAFKIVDGKREWMGNLPCKYDAPATTLGCEANFRKWGYWEFKLTGNELVGTLVVDKEKTLYRRIRVKKTSK